MVFGEVEDLGLHVPQLAGHLLPESLSVIGHLQANLADLILSLSDLGRVLCPLRGKLFQAALKVQSPGQRSDSASDAGAPQSAESGSYDN